MNARQVVTERRRGGLDSAGLREANERRSREGCVKQVGLARAQLSAHGDELPARYRAALQLRVAHPTASLTEIAADCGLTKPAYWRLLARALAWPEVAR